jgi:hypothetical protein
VTVTFLKSAFWSSSVAVSLHNRLQSLHLPALEPLLALIGFSDDLFNDTELDCPYPLIDPVFNFQWWRFAVFISEAFYRFPGKVNELLSLAVRLRLFDAIPLDSDIFQFIPPLQSQFGFLTPAQIALSRENPAERAALAKSPPPPLGPLGLLAVYTAEYFLNFQWPHHIAIDPQSGHIRFFRPHFPAIFGPSFPISSSLFVPMSASP